MKVLCVSWIWINFRVMAVPINWENIRESADVLGESTAMAGFAVLSALFRRRQFDLAYFEEATPTTPSHGVLSEENLVRLIQSNGPTIVRYVKHWIVIERIYSTKPVLFLVREPTRYTELKVQTFRDVKAGRRLDLHKRASKDADRNRGNGGHSLPQVEYSKPAA